jgi:hypothetical protein
VVCGGQGWFSCKIGWAYNQKEKEKEKKLRCGSLPVTVPTCKSGSQGEGEAEGAGEGGSDKGSRRKRNLCWEQTVRGGHVRTHIYAEDTYIR